MRDKAKLRWCLAGDAKAEDLAFIEALAQLKVLVGDPPGMGWRDCQ